MDGYLKKASEMAKVVKKKESKYSMCSLVDDFRKECPQSKRSQHRGFL